MAALSAKKISLFAMIAMDRRDFLGSPSVPRPPRRKKEGQNPVLSVSKPYPIGIGAVPGFWYFRAVKRRSDGL